jgi:hypothetical protein
MFMFMHCEKRRGASAPIVIPPPPPGYVWETDGAGNYVRDGEGNLVPVPI